MRIGYPFVPLIIPLTIHLINFLLDRCKRTLQIPWRSINPSVGRHSGLLYDVPVVDEVDIGLFDRRLFLFGCVERDVDPPNRQGYRIS